MSPVQNTDRFSLEETLAAIRRQDGYFTEWRARGYEDGFAGRWRGPSERHVARFEVYERAYRHGRDAYWRGAHGAFDRPEWGGRDA